MAASLVILGAAVAPGGQLLGPAIRVTAVPVFRGSSVGFRLSQSRPLASGRMANARPFWDGRRCYP